MSNGFVYRHMVHKLMARWQQRHRRCSLQYILLILGINPQSVHYFAEIPRFASDLKTLSYETLLRLTDQDQQHRSSSATKHRTYAGHPPCDRLRTRILAPAMPPAGMPEYGLHTAAKQCTRYPARRKARNLVRTALSRGDDASSATGGRNRELAHLSDFGQESSPHVNVVGAAPTGTEFGRGSGELRMLGVFVLSCRDA